VTARRKVLAGALALVFFCGFLALGTWQVERRSWKLALIARVDARVHAPPVPIPPRSEWPRITAPAYEYRHVEATGSFLNEAATRVQALTVLGSGDWILTPLRLADGSIVLVNRGFVGSDTAAGPATAAGSGDAAHTSHDHAAPEGKTTVTGLLRMTEPNGRFLRANDPSTNRWYSRDVQAIAAARGLRDVAPYFIDADGAARAVPNSNDPVGGLTVITFYNNHLIYAITWYTLALMIPVALWFARRDER
jgi:surfeit locus 1 family protein